MHFSIRTMFDMILPRSRSDIALDLIEPTVLMRTAVRVYAPLKPPVVAPLPYDHRLVRNTIHAAKYRAHARAAALLGRSLAGFLAEELASRRMFGTFVNATLLPIPLHERRHRERGFNQAERIAQSLIAELADPQLKIDPTLLSRTRYTEPQAHIASRTARNKNMRSAFVVPEPDRVRGHDLIVLDDVVTTGATLHTAFDVCRRAGARNILLVAAAH